METTLEGFAPRDDRSFCIDVLPEVSRTFALSIAGLPSTPRAPAEAVYLGGDTLAHGRSPKVTRAFVARVLADACDAVRSDDALRSMLDDLAGDAA